MITNKKGKLFAVIFTTVCMFVAMLGGFVGLFEAVDTSTPVIADAATSSDYYASLEDDLDLRGDAFRAELADLITGTHKYNPSYNELRYIFDNSDADPNKTGNILWFYTGTSVKFEDGGDFNSGTNREHVWPKNAGNAFPAESEAGSDAHHLRPANANLNSTRSDNSFGEVPQTNSNIVSENGSKSYANLCYQYNSTFYPGEGFRGATARILMYVQTRWGDKYSLRFVLGNGNNKTIGDIEDLLKWHIAEPPSEEEKARNEVVFGIQGNRNPFIDHPEYAEMIYCHDGESYNDELQAVVKTYGGYLDDLVDPAVEVETISIKASSTELIVGETADLTLSITPSNASKEVTWTSSNPSVATVVDGKITALSAGTTTITATSVKTPTKSATIVISVKALSAVTISGAPAKTKYEAGQTFNPAGITVTAKYSDNSTSIIPNSQVQWLDGTTRQTTLSEGTTSIIAKYGNIEKTISGITVTKSTTKTLTITRDSFSGSGSYNWHTWSASGISGYGYMYPGTTDNIQMNNSKDYEYIYNTTALPGGIVSITVKATDGKSWEVRTSSSQFPVTQNKASGGTLQGTITSSLDGTKIDINSSDKYFAISYASTGVVYVDEIIIVYKSSEDGTSCSHTAGNWIVDTPATCGSVGAQHKECTKCGEVLDAQEIPQNGSHSWGNWSTTTPAKCNQYGVEARQCSSCHATETRQIAKTQHTWGDWATTTEPECNKFGEETRQCSVCSETETKQIAKTQHTWGDWATTTEPDCGNYGEETRQCSVCSETEKNRLPKLTEHNFSDWTSDGNGNETRQCSVCSATESRVDEDFDWAKDFKDAVEAVKNATTMEEKLTAIRTALSIYNGMDNAHKTSADCVDAYIALEEEINAYNSLVGTLNSQSKQATSDAIKFFASSFSVLAFIAYLISKMI